MKDEALELAEKLERDFHEFYYGPQFYHSVAPTLISAAKKLREQHRQLEILDAVLFSPSRGSINQCVLDLEHPSKE